MISGFFLKPNVPLVFRLCPPSSPPGNEGLCQRDQCFMSSFSSSSPPWWSSCPPSSSTSGTPPSPRFSTLSSLTVITTGHLPSRYTLLWSRRKGKGENISPWPFSQTQASQPVFLLSVYICIWHRSTEILFNFDNSISQAPDSPPARYSVWSWETQFTPEQVAILLIGRNLNISSWNFFARADNKFLLFERSVSDSFHQISSWENPLYNVPLRPPRRWKLNVNLWKMVFVWTKSDYNSTCGCTDPLLNQASSHNWWRDSHSPFSLVFPKTKDFYTFFCQNTNFPIRIKKTVTTVGGYCQPWCLASTVPQARMKDRTRSRLIILTST